EYCSVEHSIRSPRCEMEVSEIVSNELPLKCAASLASSTWPVTGAPCGSTTIPSTIMSEAIVPVNLSPVCVVALSSVCVMRIGMGVPAGNVMACTTGCGGGGGACGCGGGATGCA